MTPHLEGPGAEPLPSTADPGHAPARLDDATSARPRTLRVAAVCSFLAGLLAILNGMALLGVSAVAEFILPVAALAPVVAVATLVYATLSFTLAYGLATRQPWAWVLGTGSQVLGIAAATVQMRSGAALGLLLAVAFALEILRELARPGVREALEGGATP